MLMPTITRKSQRLGVYVSIPGGWTAKVPQVQSGNKALVDGYQSYFTSCGMGLTGAHAEAHATIQRTYAHGYIDGLKEAVARRAMEYIARWPELRKVTSRRNGIAVIEPVGFRPEVIQQAYVPFQRTGRAGQAFVDDLLAEMATSALERDT